MLSLSFGLAVVVRSSGSCVRFLFMALFLCLFLVCEKASISIGTSPMPVALELGVAWDCAAALHDDVLQ